MNGKRNCFWPSRRMLGSITMPTNSLSNLLDWWTTIQSRYLGSSTKCSRRISRIMILRIGLKTCCAVWPIAKGPELTRFASPSSWLDGFRAWSKSIRNLRLVIQHQRRDRRCRKRQQRTDRARTRLLRPHQSRPTEMEIDERMVPLEPGMAVTAEIKTGSRHIIEYLLSPLR